MQKANNAKEEQCNSATMYRIERKASTGIMQSTQRVLSRTHHLHAEEYAPRALTVQRSSQQLAVLQQQQELLHVEGLGLSPRGQCAGVGSCIVCKHALEVRPVPLQCLAHVTAQQLLAKLGRRRLLLGVLQQVALKHGVERSSERGVSLPARGRERW